MKVRIDIDRNELEIDGRVAKGTHRWEALALWVLCQAQGAPVARERLQMAIQRMGQRSPLDRTGTRRLWGGVERMLRELFGNGAFAARVRFEPRHQTVGPWSLVTPADEIWELVRPVSTPAGEVLHLGKTEGLHARPWQTNSRTLPSIALTARGVMPAAFAPIELIFKADSLMLAGHMTEAAAFLQSAATSRWITAEGWGLVQLRLARLYKRRGQFDEAEDAANSVLKLATQPQFPDAGQVGMARHLLRRIRYDRQPLDYRELGTDMHLMAPSALPESRTLSESENLEALLFRRHAIDEHASGRTSEAVELLTEARRRANAAMYWAASARDHENCQNIAFNMGLINSTLHEMGDESAAVAAFRAYRLGLQLREDFFLGRDSVWDHICIGKLWLLLPDRRAEFESELAFELPGLSEPDFYVDALRQAERLGERRQWALCCVNLWRFAKLHTSNPVSASLLREARRQLLDLLQTHPDLRQTLQVDAPDVLPEMVGA